MDRKKNKGNIQELLDMQIFTPEGLLLGIVSNVSIDINTKVINGLYVHEPSPDLIPERKPVLIPYKWVQAVGQIIILKMFATMPPPSNQQQ